MIVLTGSAAVVALVLGGLLILGDVLGDARRLLRPKRNRQSPGTDPTNDTGSSS